MAKTMRLLVTVMDQNDLDNVLEVLMKTSKWWRIEDAKRLFGLVVTEKTTLYYDTTSIFEMLRLVYALRKTRCQVRTTRYLWNDYEEVKAES